MVTTKGVSDIFDYGCYVFCYGGDPGYYVLSGSPAAGNGGGGWRCDVERSVNKLTDRVTDRQTD